MIIRDEKDRFVTSFSSKKMLEKIIEKNDKAKLVFESGVDETSKAAYIVTGDCDSLWSEILKTGEPCLSRV